MTTLAPAPAGGTSTAARRRWSVLAAVALAQLLIILDTTIVNIALPSAQRELGMSDVARQWTISAYTLAFGGLLLLGGRFADRLGRRNTLLIGIAGFALASAVGGAAPDTAVLLAARAAQGVFAALLAPSTLSLVSVTFTEPRERAKAFGVFGAILMSGASLGLVLGGALAQYLDWRWCLYVNLPIAVIAGALAWFVVPNMPGHREARLDWASGLLGSGGIVALVYSLSEAATRGWDSALVLGLLAVAAASLGAFVFRQTRIDHPLLPLSVLADRNRAAAFLGIAGAAFGMFGMFLFLTYELQAIMGFGPLAAGLAFLPLIAANLLVSTQFSARVLPRIGPRPLLSGGLALLAAGMFVMTFLSADSTFAGLVLPAELLLGIGAGLAMPVVMNTATNGVSPAEAGVASAFVSTSQQVGASLGTASLNTIAAGATAAALGTGVSRIPATVHGYATAGGWAAAILATTAVGILFLIRPRSHSPAPH